MNLYMLPTSELGLQDRVFNSDPKENLGGISNYQYWRALKIALEARGITVHTTDFWSREKSQPDDVLFVQDHPGQSFFWRFFYYLKHLRTRGGYPLERRRWLLKNYKFFEKRALWHTESPIAMPWVYGHIEELLTSGIYTKIMLFGPASDKRYGHIGYYAIRNRNIESPYFADPKAKFLTMINSNTAPHSLGDEFYGERLRAIRYFAEIPNSEFDLYGHRWDKTPRHPLYFWYGKYVKKVWKGVVADKLKVLSEYTFTLCFENCSHPGYISEKIFDCLAAGSIPVYLGAPDITSVVPASCFIDFKQFKDYGELHRYLRSLTPADIEKFRASILTFLRDKTNMKGLDLLADEILN